MAKKSSMFLAIIRELRRSEEHPWKPSIGDKKTRTLDLPPSLPLGNGRQLHVNQELLGIIREYVNLIRENDKSLKSRFKVKELVDIGRQALGPILIKLDLACADIDLAETVRDDFEAKFHELNVKHQYDLDFIAGCHLLDSDDAYPIEIGPGKFQNRIAWIEQVEKNGQISKTTARRLRRLWSGDKLAKRISSSDLRKEEAIIDAVGYGKIIASVSVSGLSSAMTPEKSLLATRLAMLALALMWKRPSQGLEWMHMVYDGPVYRRHYALLTSNGGWAASSAISRMPSGHWVDEELLKNLISYQWLFSQVGESIQNYLNPDRTPVRPQITNALFISMWWYYQGLREPSDQIAVVKFGASLDAIAGGRGSAGILDFLKARLGFDRNDALMKDGRNAASVIENIYSAGRSHMIHGSSKTYSHDWEVERGTAESVGRLCIVSALDWMNANPLEKDINQIRS